MDNESMPLMGDCMKCDTASSELFEYRTGFFICRANGCWAEEVERDSGRHLILNKKLEDYRRIVSGSGGE